MTATPATRSVDRDGVRLAYQRSGGDGPPMLFIDGWFTDLDARWRSPRVRAFLDRLGSFASVISIDKRGIGRSSRVPPDAWPDIATKVGDLVAVLDHGEIDRAAVVGVSESGPVAAAFAAAHPDRISSLTLHAARAKYGAPVEDYPFGYGADELDPYVEWYETGWGTEAFAREFLGWVAPSTATDPAEVDAYTEVMRASGDGATVAAAVRHTYSSTDVRRILDAIACPTLVIGRREDEVTPVDEVRWLAAHVPGATLLELDGADHPIWAGDATTVADRVGSLVRGTA